MDKKDIKWGDWQRILFGEAPPAYLLEVVVRVGVIYIIILIAMRLLGKRMAAEVSRSELVARVSMAAAVGLPIQRQNRGILSAAVVAIAIVIVGRLLSQWAFKNQKFEKAFQGIDAILIENGVLDVKRMAKIRVTRERLFAELRSENIRHLGQVKRLYMEANGDFSIIKREEEVPGLSVIPEWDTEICERQQQTDVPLCRKCGNKWKDSFTACEHCNSADIEMAILLPEQKEEA